MLRKIWLATWNCENQFPPADLIAAFVPSAVNAESPLDRPDVIAIGVQEGVPSHGRITALFGRHSAPPQWISDHVAALLRDYDAVGSHHLAGTTKGPLNYQQLGLLVRRGVDISDLEFGDYRASFSGKGGVVCTFTLAGKRIGIMSAHLDSSSAALRKSNLIGLLQKAGSLLRGDRKRNFFQSRRNASAWPDDFDVLFLMGDLNYRLKPPGRPESANTLAAMIATDPKRLWELDTLNAALTREPIWLGFQFPAPMPLFFPTYKREYRTRGPYNPSLLFAQQERKTPAAARAAYFSHINPATFDQPLDIAKRGEYDLGWLDRVGWRASSNGSVSCAAFVDFSTLVLSDHTPVLMKVDVR